MFSPTFENTYEAWFKEALFFFERKVEPHCIKWNDEQTQLFKNDDSTRLSKCINEGKYKLFLNSKYFYDFQSLAQTVSVANDEYKWHILYDILFRIFYLNKNLLLNHSDKSVRIANLLKKAIGRDIHKMHAFVRFKKTHVDGEELYYAYYMPDHNILKLATPFFKRRFGDKMWMIATPEGKAFWNKKKLSFVNEKNSKALKINDDWEEVWKTYYGSIYNSSRVNSKAMKNEMPVRFWSGLPEAELIESLLKQ